MRNRAWFFDLLRCVAAIAVVAIHVLGPYRHQLGDVPFDQWLPLIGDITYLKWGYPVGDVTYGEWLIGVTINSFSRWAVPIFIMISGALLLSDPRPFEPKYYIRRRLAKVLLPFLVWSVFYAGLSGVTSSGTDPAIAWQTLKDMPNHETYYHLGFFYYFLPLYFLIPFLRPVVQKMDDVAIKAILGIWLLFSTMFLFSIDGPWSHELVLYGGYLLLGYALWRLDWPSDKLLLPVGVIALLVTWYMAITISNGAGEYDVDRWFSYKTLNTVLIAAFIFVLCRKWADKLTDNSKTVIGFISRYSLGIYLLHPIFLWPVREFDLYFTHAGFAIPFWTIVAFSLALAASWLLSKSRFTAWLVP